MKRLAFLALACSAILTLLAWGVTAAVPAVTFGADALLLIAGVGGVGGFCVLYLVRALASPAWLE